jgi:hypothetical protein
MSTSKSNLKKFTDDGELLQQIFCVYCHGLNEPESSVCAHCGKYIANQGPDLSARLSRLKGYARSVHEPKSRDIYTRSTPTLPTNHPDTLQLFCVHCGRRFQHDETSCFYCGEISIYEHVDWIERLNRIKAYSSRKNEKASKHLRVIPFKALIIYVMYFNAFLLILMLVVLLFWHNIR